jgi:hypothetical protein
MSQGIGNVRILDLNRFYTLGLQGEPLPDHSEYWQKSAYKLGANDRAEDLEIEIAMRECCGGDLMW